MLTRETQPFPYGDERFGRPLRNDLHFVVLEKDLLVRQRRKLARGTGGPTLTAGLPHVSLLLRDMGDVIRPRPTRVSIFVTNSLPNSR
jgi:hypothetical protein